MHHSQIQKWGNSLAVRIPIQFAKQLNLHPGSLISLNIDSGQIIISPPKYNLETMLKQITPQNRHHQAFDDTQKGNEEW